VFLIVIRDFQRRHKNKRIPPAMQISSAYSIISAYYLTSGHSAPNVHPRPTNPAFHKALPRAV
jgi:hypothetical protein